MKNLGKQITKEQFQGGYKERIKQLEQAIIFIHNLWHSPASESDIEKAIKDAMQIAKGKDQ